MSLPWLMHLANILLRPNAFVIERDTLTHFSRWFRVKRIRLADIARIDLQASPFGFSSIYLRDGSKHEFDYYLLSEKQLVHTMRELNIQIT
jgi:hypothetical protein